MLGSWGCFSHAEAVLAAKCGVGCDGRPTVQKGFALFAEVRMSLQIRAFRTRQELVTRQDVELNVVIGRRLPPISTTGPAMGCENAWMLEAEFHALVLPNEMDVCWYKNPCRASPILA